MRSEIATREGVDHLYVALPPDQHVRMLQLIESTSRECVDVKVVPDLLQVIALRARLEDLDGVPVININDVPLQGFNSLVKRAIDIVISSAALLRAGDAVRRHRRCSCKLTSRGPVFYRQERMGLDGKPFLIYKFRSMHHDAEAETGPVFAGRRRSRVGPPSAGCSAGRTSTSCRSSGTCSAATCRSSVRGPSGPTSSRSSRTGFRSTCCATK